MRSSLLVLAVLLTFQVILPAQMNMPLGVNYSTYLQADYDTYDPSPFVKTVTKEDLKELLTVIASDKFQGRETGTAGNDLAAEFIANKFSNFGIDVFPGINSYFQPIQFNWTAWNTSDLKVGAEQFRHGWDFLAYPGRNKDQDASTISEVVFMGYGIDDAKYSDYNDIDLQGRTIAVLKDEPRDKLGNSLITGDTSSSAWSTDWSKKIETAYAKGVKTILIIDNNLQKRASETRKHWFGRQVTLGPLSNIDKLCNSVYIASTLAKTIFGKSYKKVIKARKKILKGKAFSPVTIPSQVTLTLNKKESSLEGRNILGFIEGSDPKLKDEVVVITAHYDHLGKRGQDIYNGADDNGSGTSTVIEIAQAFAEAKAAGVGPRRSVLCMLVTGEEKGLLGSQYYASLPLYPLEKTVVDINVDMVGRVDKKYQDNPEYIYVIGSDRLSTALHGINEGANNRFTELTLDYTYNAEDDPNRYYYRSDHYSFAEKGIPAIFYFNGTHSDYHRTTDTVEKINFEKMEKIARLVFHTAWEISNRDERIKVDVTSE